jgi:hypothetical protein
VIRADAHGPTRGERLDQARTPAWLAVSEDTTARVTRVLFPEARANRACPLASLTVSISEFSPQNILFSRGSQCSPNEYLWEVVAKRDD